MTDDADAGDENVPISSIPSPRNHPMLYIRMFPMAMPHQTS